MIKKIRSGNALKGKKAVLLTLGITFISLVVLALASLILRNAESSEERLTEMSAAERFYNLDVSIQRGFSNVFKAKSGFNITANTTLKTLIIEKNLTANSDPVFQKFISEVEVFDRLLYSIYSFHDIATKIDLGALFTTNRDKMKLEFYPMQRHLTYYLPKQTDFKVLEIDFNSTTDIKNITIKFDSNISNGTIQATFDTAGPWVTVIFDGPGPYKVSKGGKVDFTIVHTPEFTDYLDANFNVSNLTTKGEIYIYGRKISGVEQLLMFYRPEGTSDEPLKASIKIDYESNQTEVYTSEALELSIPRTKWYRKGKMRII